MPHALRQIADDPRVVPKSPAVWCLAVDGYREALGAKHPSTLTFVYGLGSLLREQGKLSEAIPLFSFDIYPVQSPRVLYATAVWASRLCPEIFVCF